MNLLERLILRHALRKPMPVRYSPSKGDNFYAVIVRFSEDERPNFRIERLERAGFVGTWTDQDGNCMPSCLPFKSMFDPSKLIIFGQYGLHRTQYNGLRDYATSMATFYPLRLAIREWISQRAYNFALRFRSNRLEILQAIVEKEIAERSQGEQDDVFDFRGFYRWFLFEEIYGWRVLGHPEAERQRIVFDLMVESLLSSNDLISSDRDRIQTGPNALVTISAAAESNRRHRDMIFQNAVIIILTAILALKAVIEMIQYALE